MKAKLRSVLTLLWLALLATPVAAAEPASWNCDGKFGLCRYVNRETKQELIPARFERGMPFSEGLAAVSVGGRFGYIDERGEIVIGPRFDLAGGFAHGLAEILVGDKTGVINRKGEIVVPPMFQRAIPLTSDVIVAVEGAWKPNDPPGHEKLSGLVESSNANELENSGLYHVAGYWVRKTELKRVSPFDTEGRGLIWASERSSGLYGLLASNGEWIIPPQYESAGRLSDERAIVRKRVGGDSLSGAVDPTGQIVVPLRSWSLSDWKNGWSIAYQGNKQAVIDRNGNVVGGRYFDQVERAEQGDVAKVLVDGRWLGLDRAGTIVSNPDNGRLLASCPNGVRVISMDGRVQITDASGQPTAPYLFEPLLQRPTCSKPFSVNLNGAWGFVGIDGRLLFDPPAFRNQYDFERGYAVVLDGQRWGVIDMSGRFVLPAKFEKYLGRRGEVFHFAVDGREIWLTTAGEERPEPPIPHTPSRNELDCGHGVRLVEREGLWGLAEADGTEVIAPSYRALHCFQDGTGWAVIDTRRQWCRIGLDGVVREKPACRTYHYPSMPTHHAPEAFDSDVFESSVLWSRAYLEYGAGRRESPPRWIPSGRR